MAEEFVPDPDPAKEPPAAVAAPVPPAPKPSPAPAASSPPVGESGPVTVTVRCAPPTTRFASGVQGVPVITANGAAVAPTDLSAVQEAARKSGVTLITEEA